MGFWKKVKGYAGDAWDSTGGAAIDWYEDATNRDQTGALGKLEGQGEAASGFAGSTQAEFGRLGAEASANRDYLRDIASGKESVSRIQLQQALAQNQATQQSMAAGARPANAAMAARTAAMTAGRQGAGLAGQQALAGIQERQGAQNALQQALMQQRQQELNAALGSRGQAIGAFGTSYTGQMNTPTALEKGMTLGKDVASTYGTVAGGTATSGGKK